MERVLVSTKTEQILITFNFIWKSILLLPYRVNEGKEGQTH